MASYEKNNIDAPPLQHIDTTDQDMTVKEYVSTRISTLRPPMAKVANPFKLLSLLNTQQWMFFLVAFFAWSWDAFDFFTGTTSYAFIYINVEYGNTSLPLSWQFP